MRGVASSDCNVYSFPGQASTSTVIYITEHEYCIEGGARVHEARASVTSTTHSFKDFGCDIYPGSSPTSIRYRTTRPTPNSSREAAHTRSLSNTGVGQSENPSGGSTAPR